MTERAGRCGRPAIALLIAAAGIVSLSCRGAPPPFAEAAVLTADNFERFAPAGKEADAIVGDYVLRNDRIVAVIGNPVPRRDANATVLGVGGAVIDLTLRQSPNDLLAAFYPGGGWYTCNAPQMTGAGEVPPEVPRGDPSALQALAVAWTCLSPQRAGRPEVRVTYSLRGGEPYLTVTSEMTNSSDETMEAPIEDVLRADGPSFEKAPGGEAESFWAYDRWFGQAYGLAAEGRAAFIQHEGESTVVRWTEQGRPRAPLLPGRRLVVTRRLAPAAHSIAARAVEARRLGRALRSVRLLVVDATGRPLAGADAAFLQDGAVFGGARTGADGTVDLELPAGDGTIEVRSAGVSPRMVSLGPGVTGAGSGRSVPVVVEMEAGSRLSGRITDTTGASIPAKVILTGLEGTPTPDLGPVTGSELVGNLVYTPDGRFVVPLAPGVYQVIASHGPEHDTVTRRVEVAAGSGDILFEAALRRSVETPGWISADFHGHTTASGDTAASVRGRVLNLAAEQIDFAPSTEHNRIETYEPEIEALGLRRFLATCPGLELTRDPFAVNHQNAFPLVIHPHTQGNGAPGTHRDPAEQIRRLAGWDDGSEKLVQQNHPDIGWIFHDSDEDGRRDKGFAGMFPWQDVIEVYGSNILKMEPFVYSRGPGADGGPEIWYEINNRIFNWLQLLNQGVRIPGVANTDAHVNANGSGGVRNYVRSATDEPDRIDPIDIVRHAERGHVVMTNGPFLEASVRPAGATGSAVAIPGDEIAAPEGRVQLHVRVQCPNWFDIDRVYVLVNGRAREDLKLTRYTHGKLFSQGSVKFDRKLDVALASDAHLIVVAAHKLNLLEPVMGSEWGGSPPVAISNPIYVDVDGGGFTANGDTLGHPLPVKGGKVVDAPPPSYR